MSEVKVNKITPTTNCGTVTLGDSGDTVVIPCGVTLSNSGSITNSGTITNTGTISGGTITGTIDNQVNWDTTAKTANFTAVAGNGYFVNTTSGAITVTLPATPSAGDLVGIKDYANTANTNNITIDRNGEPIQGTANNFTISVAGTSITLIYVDGTQGWVSTGAAKASDISEQALFTVATGGCITTCGDFKIHTFTGPGTFCVSQIGNNPTVPAGGPTTVSYMVVAGGGGGGSIYGGGGGAGGFREGRDIGPSYTASPLVAPAGLTITATAFPITVGAGGPANTSPGASSIFSTITSTGGGRGRANSNGDAGGSGAGGSNNAGTTAGTGNTPPVSPPQGNSGGTGSGPSTQSAGGGGGAGATGGPGWPSGPSQGGNGVTTSISGSPTAYAGGGAGSIQPPAPPSGFSGGTGGGGPSNRNSCGTAGTANTGGGGGGGANNAGDFRAGGNGGSGIVIIRYKYQ